MSKFIEEVVDGGIEGAKRDYKPGDPKLIGSIEGFESCRGKNTYQLSLLLKEAKENTQLARTLAMDKSINKDEYWKVRCFELEVEWVCNCVSVVLCNEGWPVIVVPTARAFKRACEILGVDGDNG